MKPELKAVSLALLFAVLLTACAKNAEEAGTSNEPPAASSDKWDQLIWDKGNWAS